MELFCCGQLIENIFSLGMLVCLLTGKYLSHPQTPSNNTCEGGTIPFNCFPGNPRQVSGLCTSLRRQQIGIWAATTTAVGNQPLPLPRPHKNILCPPPNECIENHARTIIYCPYFILMSHVGAAAGNFNCRSFCHVHLRPQLGFAAI